jgi:hypothetical protein
MDAQEWSLKYGRENVPVVINVNNPEYLDYYFTRMELPPMVVADRIQTPRNFHELDNLLSKARSKYFAYTWSNSTHPFEVPEIIRSHFPYLVEKKNYFNAGSYLFSRDSIDKGVNNRLYFSECDFEQETWNSNPMKISTENFSGNLIYKVDEEFGPSLKKKNSEIPGNGFRYVSFSAKIYELNPIKDAQLVISFDRDGKPFEYHGEVISQFNLKTNNWQFVILAIELPKDILPTDVISAYCWNPSKEIFYLDDIKFEIFSDADPYFRDVR